MFSFTSETDDERQVLHDIVDFKTEQNISSAIGDAIAISSRMTLRISGTSC